MGGCCSDDNNVDSPHGSHGHRHGHRRGSAANPLAGNRIHRSDSLSDITFSDNDENDALADHFAPDDFSRVGSGSAIFGSAGASPNGSGSPTGSGSSFRSASANSSSASNALTADLGRAREEGEIDLTDEFFVWDDMKYDLRSEKARQQAFQSGGAGGGAGGLGAFGAYGSSSIGAIFRPRGASFVRSGHRQTHDDNLDTTSTSPTTTKDAPGAGKPKSSPFVFNDFSIDEIDKVDEVSFFAAAALVAQSPRRHSHAGEAGVAVSPNGGDAAGAASNEPSPLSSQSSSHHRRHSVSHDVLRTLGGNPEDIRNVSFTTLGGHTTRVKVLAVAPGEKEYVSCSSDDVSLTYGDLTSGKELGAFIGHTDAVLHATFSYCGKYLSSTSRDNTMILWDVVTQKALLTFEHQKVVICAAFSRDSRFVVTGCQDKVCRLWEARRGRELGTFAQHEGIIIALTFSPDGSFCVSASSDRTLRKWAAIAPLQPSPQSPANGGGSMPTSSPTTPSLSAKQQLQQQVESIGKQRGVMKGHDGIILTATITSDGRYIVSNDEKQVRVWDAETCKCHKVFTVDEAVPLRNLPPNKKLTWTLASAAPGCFPNSIVVAANNRFLYVFDIESGREEVSMICKMPIYCLTAGPRSVVLAGDSFGNVVIVRLGNPFMTLEPPAPTTRPATPALSGKSLD